MKNVTLIYTYGLNNVGDMAINLGAIDILLEMGVKISAVSRFASGDPEYDKMVDYLNVNCPGLKIIECPFRLVRGSATMERVRQHAHGLFKVLGFSRTDALDNVIKQSDMVIFNGGNFLRLESFADLLRLIALTFPLKKSRKYRIPYVIFPQSASNIGFWGKRLLRRDLQQAKKVWTREDISYEYVARKINNIPLSKSIDLAFFIRRKPADISSLEQTLGRGISGHKLRRIAVTLRAHDIGDLMEISSGKYNKIVNTIKDLLAKYLYDGRYEVILLLQTAKDLKITHEVYQRLSDSRNLFLIEEYDPLKVKEILSRCDVLLGMRLHSVVLSLAGGTPAVGYFDRGWGFKNPGLMDRFGLPYKFIDDDPGGLDGEIKAVLEKAEYHKENIKVIIENERERFKQELGRLL